MTTDRASRADRPTLVDVVVVGGGPSGATAAEDLARRGHSVVLLDKAGRIKPCGGAIPPRLIADFAIPGELLVARVRAARMVSPKLRKVDMPIDGGFVGMVDRDVFDEWLRERAAAAGCRRETGTFETFVRDPDGTAVVRYRPRGAAEGESQEIRARAVIGADGARSGLGRQTVKGADKVRCVFAYHEIVSSPVGVDRDGFDPTRCDVHYRGTVSPDFYGWIFPHGSTTSVGTGSARKGFALRASVDRLRREVGLGDVETLRREGAPIPMKPLRRWDNGRDVLLAGDAAGVVAPASGEGIYYAMLGGRLAADAVTGVSRDRQGQRPRGGAQAVHARTRPGVLGAGADAGRVVPQRRHAGAFRRDLPRPRRPAPDLGLLHEQAPEALRSAGPSARLRQGHGASAPAGLAVAP